MDGIEGALDVCAVCVVRPFKAVFDANALAVDEFGALADGRQSSGVRPEGVIFHGSLLDLVSHHLAR